MQSQARGLCHLFGTQTLSGDYHGYQTCRGESRFPSADVASWKSLL